MTLLKEFSDLEMFINSLSSLGVDCFFGCDEQELMLLKDTNLRYVRMQHEQAAVHAADGFARATGKPGVVLLTTASGITNSTTGIATAYSDSVPLVIIAGQIQDDPLHTNHEAFLELNISGLTMAITKHALKINNIEGIQEALKNCLTMATNGRPGPVLLELTTDTTMNVTQNHRLGRPQLKRRNRIENSIKMAKSLMETARKPVLFIGGGTIASGAADYLREVVKQTRIPVVSSLMGIGSMEAGNPLYLGMLGMHGTFAANKAVHHCDLLISIGVRFSDRVTGRISGFSPSSKKIHVDIDPAEINKIIPIDLPIVSDAKEFLSTLKNQLDYQKINENTGIWSNEVVEWKRTVPRFDQSNSVLNPQMVIRLLSDSSTQDTVVVTDVGQHQIWTAHHYAFTRPRTLITSGGLETMGYGLPAAIGAAAACPGRSVICVSGDGSFQMNLQELVTAVKYQLPLKIAILNNGYLGMVRQWQELFYQGRYSQVKMTSPNFAQLAQAYGVTGFRAQTEEESKQIIGEAFQCTGPVLMEFNIMEEEKVYPMVPPNHNNHQTILSR
ncbi:biosynthetic-type acetolactate synthase large subunit [Bacillus sp. AFS031507]|uniref:biosynthetic-type acetolactate synthase large subunit n=1 Tax=Bacillus sp. AFS031507 TaxID=2033496 RepID=UPI000BFC6E49|nr:biosynthetic-type acetolactate synthase large subunit [Bacillus sp. AFS031507]PGY10363.1 acetolactate synthase, large subunit, biosynthetic type [Bacillus sp. AFS031507]